jgi:hypothetical protein
MGEDLSRAAMRLLRAILIRALLDVAECGNERFGCCTGSRTCPENPASCASRWLRSDDCRMICRTIGVPHKDLVRNLRANARKISGMHVVRHTR